MLSDPDTWVNECEALPDEDVDVYLLLVDDSDTVGYGTGSMSSKGWVLKEPARGRVLAWVQCDRILSLDDLKRIPRDKIRRQS